MGYKVGDDIEFITNLKDRNDDPILLSSLEGYGVEIYLDDTLIGKWGNNLTGFTDDYWSVQGTSSVKFKIPSTEITSVGNYYGEFKIAFSDADYPDSLRDLYGKRKLLFRVTR